jgi:general secretion pathway protein K
MKFTRQLLGKGNQRGVALLIAIFTMMFIFYLVTEILYDSNVEYVVHAQSVSRLKAYYAARSGMQLSLLRIKIYQQVAKQFGSKAQGEQKKLLDMIWSMPFAWPPVIPDEVNSVDKDLIKSKVKEAQMDATYVTMITDEGSKIDVNDLNSPSKALHDVTRTLLTQVFENKMQNDEAWAAQHRDVRIEEIINAMEDWETETPTSLNGGSKQSFYSKFNSTDLPPHRAFRTVDEVRMVTGMTDDIWDLYKDRITVYGMHAINPNYATKEVLMSLDASIKPEVADAIIARRNDDNLGGFFNNAQDFWGFANEKGASISPDNQKQIPLVFDAVYNFRIRSVGDFGGATQEIEAVTFDMASVANTVAVQLNKEKHGSANQNPPGGTTPPPADPAAGGGNPPPGGNSSPTSSDPLPKGPPRIVYYNEK